MAETITVGCNLPSGLIITHLDRTVRLNGSDASGGHGLTSGIDKDWFLSWVGANPDSKVLAIGAVLYDNKDTKGLAKEMSGIQTGFEGLDPDKPMQGIEKANA